MMIGQLRNVVICWNKLSLLKQVWLWTEANVVDKAHIVSNFKPLIEMEQK